MRQFIEARLGACITVVVGLTAEHFGMSSGQADACAGFTGVLGVNQVRQFAQRWANGEVGACDDGSKVMQISKAGLDLIKEFEGLYLKAYRCPAGVPTIGYGHTAGVVMGQTITKQQADDYLRRDVRQFERAVARLVSVPLTQGQFDALVSFAFNLGEGALAQSTLLRLLNAGDYAGAAAQFDRWNKAGGRVLPGLVRRRAAERALFEARP